MSFPSTLALAICLVSFPGLAASPPPWQGWGGLIGEPELDAMIESALHESSLIAASRASTRVQALATRLSRASRHPEINVGAALRTGREKNASTGFEEDEVERWDMGGAVRLDLDVFGALRARTRGAHQAEQLSGFELRNHELAWAASMTRLLLRLRYQQHKEDTTKAMVKTQQLSRDWARSRVEAGLLSASGLEAFESLLLQARQNHLAEMEESAVLAAQWKYLAGNVEIPVAGTHHDLPGMPQPGELHGWVTNRPDVQAARAAWLGADYRATASQRSRYPSLSAGAKAGGEGPSPVDDPEEWTAWAGLQLELPLWAPEEKARALRDREQVVVEESMYQDAMLASLKELQQTYARRVHAETAWTLATENARRSEERLATAQRKFDQGLIMLTDLETARNQWLTAANAAARAHTQLLTNHVDLVQAGGGPGAALIETP